MYKIGLWTITGNFQCLNYPFQSKAKLLALNSAFVVVVTNENQVFYYAAPYAQDPVHMPLVETVIDIQTNKTMALFLTRTGIWLFGEDLQRAELFGLDGVYSSEIPVRLEGTPNGRIVSTAISDRHGGIVCEDGTLYTWGTGLKGELGSKYLKKSKVHKVDNGDFFKAIQVVCGEEFTGIVTQGGFLYLYGNRANCTCGGINGYPAIIPSLEPHFVSKCHAYKKGLVLQTDKGEIFYSKRCLCLIKLPSNLPVYHLATFEAGICGLSRDKAILHLWSEAHDWELKVLSLNNTINLIHSGHGTEIGLFGSDFELIHEQAEKSENDSNSNSNSELIAQDRTDFDSIFGNFNLKTVSQCFNHSQLDSCKILFIIMSKNFAECFRKIKEFGLIKLFYQKVYFSKIVLNAIEKVELILRFRNRKFAFAKIKRKALCFKRRVFNLPQSKKILLMKLLCFKNMGKVVEVYSRLFLKVAEKLSLQKLKSLKHPFEISLRIIETHNNNRLASAFNIWKIKSKPVLKTSINCFGEVFAKIMTKYIKASIKPLIQDRPLRMGLVIVSRFIKNKHSKLKSQCFNSLLLQKPTNSRFDDSKSCISSNFDCPSPLISSKAMSLLTNHKTFLKLILINQSIHGKLKFKMLLKGFNSFLNNMLNKTFAIDNQSQKSIKVTKACPFFITPPCISPILDINKRTSERSTIDSAVNDCGRKASVGLLQEQVRKRIKETDGRKAKPKKMKLIAKKRSEIESTLDKRKAYGENLKNRQNRRESSGLFTSCSSRKQSFFSSPRNKSFSIQLV